MASKPTENTLASAMAAAFSEIEAATKSANNPHFKSKYADLGAVIEAIKPPLIKHGLFFTQHCHPAPDGVSVETVLHHACGDHLSLGVLFLPASKKDPQGFGSALTYARRYGLVTAFGVPVEDDDGNAAVKSINDDAKDGPIDDGQWATLVQKIEATGTDTQAFCAYMKVSSLKVLPQSKYADAVAALDAKAAKVKEAA